MMEAAVHRDDRDGDDRAIARFARATTRIFTSAARPQGSNNLFVAWETLTHAGNPA
jgi:hypothetical protein